MCSSLDAGLIADNNPVNRVENQWSPMNSFVMADSRWSRYACQAKAHGEKDCRDENAKLTGNPFYQ